MYVTAKEPRLFIFLAVRELNKVGMYAALNTDSLKIVYIYLLFLRHVSASVLCSLQEAHCFFDVSSLCVNLLVAGYIYTRVGTLIVATIYLQLIQNRYMFRRLLSFSVVTSIVYNPLPAMWKS